MKWGSGMNKRIIIAAFAGVILSVGIRVSDIKNESIMTFSGTDGKTHKSITLEDLANCMFLEEDLR